MRHEPIRVPQAQDQERLESFGIRAGNDDVFRRVSDILRPHAMELATLYIDRFLAGAGIKVDEKTRAAQIEKTAEYSSNKYTPPIDSGWIGRVEKMGALQFKLRAPSHANLSALSASHRASAELIFEAAETVEDGRYLVDQFMRIAALEVEIMVATIQRLEQDEYSQKLRQRTDDFENSIARIIESSSEVSADARDKSGAVAKSADTLLDLSAEVAAATSQSTTAMEEAARMSAGLDGTISQIEQEISTAFASFSELAETAKTARTSATSLTQHTQSIEKIVKLIQSIADQTKILALNALIEAASAGKAGAGFSVVATEMKHLATQTESATMEIGSLLGAIGARWQEAIATYQTMIDKYEALRDTAGSVRKTLADQSRDVTAIAGCIDETAQSSSASAEAMAAISKRAGEVNADIAEVSASIGKLDDMLDTLHRAADEFAGTLAR